MTLPIESTETFVFFVHSPTKSVDNRGVAGIRFSVSLKGARGGQIDIPGWRLMYGKIYPPARQYRNAYTPVLMLDAGLMRRLEKAVWQWQESFPAVTFPVEEVKEL